METCFNYCDKTKAFFSSDEIKYIKKIYELQKDYRDEVQILAHPDKNDGCIYCSLPVSWFSIKPPRKHNITDEQREALRERMNAMRERQAAA